MHDHVVLRVISKLLMPLIMLYALYVQFHGDYGPGGGFQAGVIFAAGIILYALIFGLEEARAVVRPWVLRIGLALGVLTFAGTGVATMLLGGNFLDYNLLAQHAQHGQHMGILIVEFGVLLTVASGLLTIFYVFAGRGKRRRDVEE
jgi:multicomponent Na+:H+ antiporter subunit B